MKFTSQPVSPRPLAILLLIATPLMTALAQTPEPAGCPTVVGNETGIFPADGNFDGQFGTPSDIDGNFAVIAAPEDDDNGVPGSGAFYVYRNVAGSWLLDDKVTLVPPIANDQFASAVAISEDFLVVGAPSTTVGGLFGDGAAYVYRRIAGLWRLEATLTRTDPGPQLGAFGDQFGVAVDISRDRIIVGSPRDDDQGLDSGAAYIFERQGIVWNQTAKLTASDGPAVAMRGFGVDVALDGNVAVVGPRVDDTLGQEAGAAYVYEFDGTSWAETKLFASDGRAFDFFGRQVDVDGFSIIVGANGDDDLPAGSIWINEGAAYIFEKDRTGWVQRSKLFDFASGPADFFGNWVAIDDELAAVGRVDFPNVVGATYLYERRANGSWGLVEQFLNSDAMPGDPGSFGASVNLSADRLLVGAPGEDGVALDAGAAYIYELVGDCAPVQPQ